MNLNLALRMRTATKRGLQVVFLAAAFAFAAQLPAEARDVATPQAVLSEAEQSVPGGRGVQVVVSQVELGANINPSYVMVAMGGGVLGALIDANIQASRGRHASVGITPIRMALNDFDADQLAIDTTSASVGDLTWFAGSTPSFSRDPTTGARSLFLDAAAYDQSAFFQYVYDVAPDFGSVRVGVTITLANKASNGKNPERRLAQKNLVYTTILTSVVQLNNPGAPADNSKRWAANHGQLSRRALNAAFAQIRTLIPRALTFGPDELKKMDSGERRTIGIYSGKLIEEGPDGVLLFNGGLTHVQTIAE